MAAKKIRDAVVTTGSYTDRASGQPKSRFENVGAVWRSDDGGTFLTLKRSFNPAGVPHKEGADSILISFYELRENAQPGAAATQTQAPAPARAANPDAEAVDDDIPF